MGIATVSSTTLRSPANMSLTQEEVEAIIVPVFFSKYEQYTNDMDWKKMASLFDKNACLVFTDKSHAYGRDQICEAYTQFGAFNGKLVQKSTVEQVCGMGMGEYIMIRGHFFVDSDAGKGLKGLFHQVWKKQDSGEYCIYALEYAFPV